MALTDGGHLDRQPVWHPAGSRIYFVSDRGGLDDVWSLPVGPTGRAVGPPASLTQGIGVASFALEPDGRRIVYSRVQERSNIWRLAWTGGPTSTLRDAVPLTVHNQRVESLDVSPDGEWVVFDSDRSGTVDLWRMRRDGSGLHPMTGGPHPSWRPSFSPDGKHVVFHSLRDGNRDLYRTPVNGVGIQRLTRHPATDWLPRWSPDGAWIAFGSDRSGNPDIWLVPSSGGEPSQLTQSLANDHNAVWHPDGGRLLFSSDRAGSHELFEIDVDGGAPRQLTHHGWHDVIAFAFASDAETVFVWSREREGGGEARFQTVRRGEVRPLFSGSLGSRRIMAALAAHADELFFPLFERVGDLWLARLEE